MRCYYFTQRAEIAAKGKYFMTKTSCYLFGAIVPLAMMGGACIDNQLAADLLGLAYIKCSRLGVLLKQR